MAIDHVDSKTGNLLPQLLGLFFRLAERVLLYAPSHRQDRTYHSPCYTSYGALAGMGNSSMDSPGGIDLMTHYSMSGCSTMELYLVPIYHIDDKQSWEERTGDT